MGSVLHARLVPIEEWRHQPLRESECLEGSVAPQCGQNKLIDSRRSGAAAVQLQIILDAACSTECRQPAVHEALPAQLTEDAIYLGGLQNRKNLVVHSDRSG